MHLEALQGDIPLVREAKTDNVEHSERWSKRVRARAELVDRRTQRERRRAAKAQAAGATVSLSDRALSSVDKATAHQERRRSDCVRLFASTAARVSFEARAGMGLRGLLSSGVVQRGWLNLGGPKGARALAPPTVTTFRAISLSSRATVRMAKRKEATTLETPEKDKDGKRKKVPSAVRPPLLFTGTLFRRSWLGRVERAVAHLAPSRLSRPLRLQCLFCRRSHMVCSAGASPIVTFVCKSCRH